MLPPYPSYPYPYPYSYPTPTPTVCQGGCMAIEDAFVLGRELRGVGHDREQVPLALSRLA